MLCVKISYCILFVFSIKLAYAIIYLTGNVIEWYQLLFFKLQTQSYIIKCLKVEGVD